MSLRHRLFAYLLLWRPPLESELGDIDAALRRLVSKKGLLAILLVYAMVLYIGVWPAFSQPQDLLYRVVAVVITHLLLCFIAWVAATSSVGFRSWQEDSWLAPQVVTVLSIATFIYFAVGGHWSIGAALNRWWGDVDRMVIWLSFFWAATSLPFAFARIRQRELVALTRALSAEAATEKLARKTAEADLRLLQAQVEPHFLYNTLANLRYLIQKNSPEALRMTDALIEYLRTSVPDIRALRVPLGRETDHAHHYLEIMQMRMGDRLAFSVDVPEDLRAIEVPPLMLLTLVENAVKHGIAPQIEGGEVRVRAREVGDSIEIEVADTGVGAQAASDKPADAPSTGVGLDNLRSRLQLAYGTEIPVALHANTPRGTRIQLLLPRAMPHMEVASAQEHNASASEQVVNNARPIAASEEGGAS